MMHNYKYALHKFVFELIKERYPKHKEIIERIACYFPTENDTKNIMELMHASYEAGYMKAYEDYKDQMAKMGILATVKNETTQL